MGEWTTVCFEEAAEVHIGALNALGVDSVAPWSLPRRIEGQGSNPQSAQPVKAFLMRCEDALMGDEPMSGEPVSTQM